MEKGAVLMNEKKILTIRQTVEEFGVAEYALRRWVKQKQFPVFQSGNRVYINRRIFETFLDEGGAKYEAPDPARFIGFGARR